MREETLSKTINGSADKLFPLMEKENISEEFSVEISMVYQEYVFTLLEEIEDYSILEEESEVEKLYDRLLLTMQSKVKEQEEKYKGEINSDFFNLLAKATLLIHIKNFFKEAPLEEKDSEYVNDLKMEYFGKYYEWLNSLDETKDLVQETFDNFITYITDEMNRSKLNFFEGEIDSEENQSFVREKAEKFQQKMTQTDKEKIGNLFLEYITVGYGYLLLKIHHAKANPFGVHLELSPDSTREDVESGFKQLMERHPTLFQDKNLDDLVNEAMAQIESGEQYNDTAKKLIKLREMEEQLNHDKEVLESKIELEEKALTVDDKENEGNGVVFMLLGMGIGLFIYFVLLNR